MIVKYKVVLGSSKRAYICVHAVATLENIQAKIVRLQAEAAAIVKKQSVGCHCQD